MSWRKHAQESRASYEGSFKETGEGGGCGTGRGSAYGGGLADGAGSGHVTRYGVGCRTGRWSLGGVVTCFGTIPGQGVGARE